MTQSNIHVTKITEEDYKKLEKFELDYGITKTQFGPVLLATHEDKICYAAFVNDSSVASTHSINDLKKEFPKTILKEDNEKIQSLINELFEDQQTEKPVNIMLKGTEFQTKVWEQLLSLKKGSTYSYEDVAKLLSNPKAIRAVAKAVSSNKLAYIIPCHRVISKSGGLSKYKWGADRKKKILSAEGAL